MNKEKWAVFAVLICLVSGCKTAPLREISDASTSSEISQPTLSYKEEYERVLNLDKTADFTNLRISYTNTENYRPYGVSPDKAVFEALGSGRYELCIERAENNLKTNFVSISMHYALAACYEEMQNEESSNFHKFVLNGLLSSIGRSGDGKSMETAFVTISADELYAFLQLSGLKVTGQSLVNGELGAFDRMEVVDTRNEREFSLYFNINLQMNKGMGFLDSK